MFTRRSQEPPLAFSGERSERRPNLLGARARRLAVAQLGAGVLVRVRVLRHGGLRGREDGDLLGWGVGGEGSNSGERDGDQRLRMCGWREALPFRFGCTLTSAHWKKAGGACGLFV